MATPDPRKLFAPASRHRPPEATTTFWAPGCLELRRQLRDDAFGAARAVGLDQMGDAQTFERCRGIRRPIALSRPETSRPPTARHRTGAGLPELAPRQPIGAASRPLAAIASGDSSRSAHRRRGPRSQRSIGTEKPIFGRSTMSRGTRR